MLEVSSARNIVAFRNRLVHGYETIRDETIWEAIQKSLPVLLADVRRLLAKLNRYGDDRDAGV